MTLSETFFSVDIETAGPFPGKFAMLSIGACVAYDIEQAFYCELQPDKTEFEEESLGIHGLSLEKLAVEGSPPIEAMSGFSEWINHCLPTGSRPIFLAFNTPFDWMFINDYFHRYLGTNPFGHAALDIKGVYMGFRRLNSFSGIGEDMRKNYPPDRPLTHNALEDAKDQARLFQRMMHDLQKGV